MDERVRRGTDHYIDDIVVRESVLSAQELREHLARYGLESKAPEGLDGGRVLGISLRKGSGGHLEMSRGMALSEIVMDQSRLTKRGLFSLCGRLVGHYPVAGWLRPCCSFLKRLGCGGSWDEPVESSVGELANELLVRARAEDPVRGRWHVSPHGTVTVWTDASSLGMGVALEVDGSVAEDASWLRKESDHRHINVAELEAVARGINLAISWGFKTFTVATDSRTVISWMDNTVEGHRRVRTKGASEMLIKRRLGVIRDTITEFGLTVTVRFVSTTENKADRMTRVPKKWLGHRDTGEEGADVSAALATGESVEDAIWAAHLPHHLGVDRTLYLARQIRSNLTREQVKRELVGFLPESPRWLLNKGRLDHLRIVLKKFAKLNNKEPFNFDLTKLKADGAGSESNAGITDLFKTPNIRKKVLLLIYINIISAFTYFGLSLFAPALGSNPFVSVCLVGAAEIPGDIIAFFIMDRWGRRWTIVTTFVLAGIFSILVLESNTDIISCVMHYDYEFQPKFHDIMMSRSNTILVYCLLGREYMRIPLVITGALSLTGGLCTLLLPETLHQPLPETIPEAEEFGRKMTWADYTRYKNKLFRILPILPIMPCGSISFVKNMFIKLIIPIYTAVIAFVKI
ncbi:Carcinine transporter [Nymphon striatum]|nr:Carcinine transporter [Nymphon striatum]